MIDSVLDQRFTLEDLLDIQVLQDVLESFGQTFGLGVAVYSGRRVEVISACPRQGFCEAIKNGKSSSQCDKIREKIVSHPMGSSQVLQIKSFCGMRYSVFALTYQLEELGRVVIGPYRAPEMKTELIVKLAGEGMDASVSVESIEKVPAYSRERLRAIIRLLVKFLDAYLFVNAKRLITTKLHLEAVFSDKEEIFKKVELQDSGSAEDKEEIEKLKNMF